MGMAFIGPAKLPFTLECQLIDVLDHLGTGFDHLASRARRISLIEFHAADRIFQNHDFEAKLAAVEDCLLDAVIGGQSDDENFSHPSLFEPICKLNAPVIYRIEAGIAVGVRRHALRADDRFAAELEPAMEFGTVTSLDAMHRPYSAKRFEMSGLFRMPVASGENRQSSLRESLEVIVDGLDDAIAFGDCERAARTEIVLYVNQDERSVSVHRF